MKSLSRWIQFIMERFNPLYHFPMIVVFIGSHYTLYTHLIATDLHESYSDFLHLIPLFLAVALFFFILRLYDEIKDIEFDKNFHPERPVPRGFLHKREIKQVILFLIIVEILIFSFYGKQPLLLCLITIGYSLLMYKEFFLKEWLRAHLTTYAITHTFIVILISQTLFIALFANDPADFSLDLLYFSFGGWFIFNIFEFGRKTYAQSEEKKNLNSYSKVFGKLGAVLLVMLMTVLNILFLDKLPVTLNINLIVIFTVVMGFVGLIYAISKDTLFAKLYRSTTLLYIILTYTTITIFCV